MQTHVFSIYKTILHRVNAVNGRHEKMNSVKLHIALHNAVEKFGSNILCEDRLINILLDYGAFNDNPAIKNILKTMIVDGYCQKVLDLARRKRFSLSFLLNQSNKLEKPQGEEWKTKVQSYCVDFTKKNGYLQDLVVYATEGILYALGWKTYEPNNIIVSKNVKVSKSGSSQSSVQSVVVSNTTITPKMSGTNTNITNSVTYQTISNTQFLVINVKPLNAEVYVDGKQQYVSNGISAVELTIGKHNYEVRSNSYETQKGTIDIKSTSKQNLDIVLKLQQTLANLTIECTDADAEISTNGKILGIGKWTGLVKSGNISIECRKNRCYPYTIIQKISNGKDCTIKIPTLQPMCGNIKIDVQPYGSKIFINGKEEGTTPLMVTGVQIGERMLRVLTSEGQDYVTTIDVQENKVTDVNHIIPSLFLDDYSQLNIGDWYYEDGTFSHVKADGKIAVGIVFSLVTSEEEKKHGWTHGQIMAVKEAHAYKMFQGEDEYHKWGIYSEAIYKYAVTSIKNIELCMPSYSKDNYSKYDKGYAATHEESIFDNKEYPIFYAANHHDAPLPKGKTSGWYLPSIYQAYLLRNVINKLDFPWDLRREMELDDLHRISTSSMITKETAWQSLIGGKKLDSGWFHVRPVASF